MTHDEEDSRYPKQAEKFSKARQRYILQGTPIETLAQMLELPLHAVRQRASDEKWDTLRLESLKTSSAEAQHIFKQALTPQGDNPLAQHAISADAAVKLGYDYLVMLVNAETTISDIRLIRSKVEAYTKAVEGLEKAIELARKTRGIANSAPSLTQEAEATQVMYEVTVAPAKAEAS